MVGLFDSKNIILLALEIVQSLSKTALEKNDKFITAFSIKILNELFLLRWVMLATMLDKYLEKRRFEMRLSRQPLSMKIGEIILTTEL